MCIDDIGGPRTCEQDADSFPVIKRMNFNGLQECRQSSLASAIAPYLSDHRVGRVQRNASSLQRSDQGTGRLLVAINGDQKTRIENHNL
jgi:hypothetical protein